MLRVRDELKMTLISYQTLYESSIAFGIRKALKAEQGEEISILFSENIVFQEKLRWRHIYNSWRARRLGWRRK